HVFITTSPTPAVSAAGFASQAGERVIVWNPRRGPGCSASRVSAPPRPPWVPFNAESHYPPRHGGRMNGLFHDGHVQALLPANLRVRNFREPDSDPPVAGFPGE